MIHAYLETLTHTLPRVPREPVEAIVAVLQRARREGKRVFLMGNGGSAATASHFVNDLLKGTTQPGQPRFTVMCLADNVSTLTAYANDTSYERIFAEPLAALAEPGDVVIAISGSGNSPNVLRAMDTARPGLDPHRPHGLCGRQTQSEMRRVRRCAVRLAVWTTRSSKRESVPCGLGPSVHSSSPASP